jgi:hypothetical protein
MLEFCQLEPSAQFRTGGKLSLLPFQPSPSRMKLKTDQLRRVEDLGVCKMRKFLGLSTPIWIAVWAVAITGTLIGGSSGGAIWKAYIQLPGVYLVLLFGWLIGPFQTIMSPPIVGVLTILTNVAAYYLLVRIILFLSRKIEAMTEEG